MTRTVDIPRKGLRDLKLNGRILFGGGALLLLLATGIVMDAATGVRSRPVQRDSYCTPSLFGASVRHSAAASGGDRETAGGLESGLGGVMADESATPCSRNYLFGTDFNGRDLARHTFVALPAYLLPALIVVAVTILLGCLFGVLTGYYRDRWFSGPASVVSQALSVFPPLLILLLTVWIFEQPPLWVLGTVFALTEATRMGSLVTNKIAALREEDFIGAARELGLSDRRIITRHILWYNCRELLAVQSVFSVAGFVLGELSLGYFNVAAYDTWGGLVGATILRSQFLQHAFLLLPYVVIVLGLASLLLLGDGLVRRFGAEEEIYR